MQTLIEKMRTGREQAITVESYQFTIRRPNEWEMSKFMVEGGMPMLEVFKLCVVNWDNVKQLDLIPGGTGEAVVFDSALFVEWIADKSALWTPLHNAIVGICEDYVSRQETQEKKPQAG